MPQERARAALPTLRFAALQQGLPTTLHLGIAASKGKLPPCFLTATPHCYALPAATAATHGHLNHQTVQA